MKKHFAFLLLFLSTVTASVAQDKFIGNWENTDKSAVVEIYEMESQYYAKIVTGKNPGEIGKVVLIQMDRKSDSRLFGGTYYDGKLDSEYEAKLKLVNADTIQLKILTGIFTKTILWHRIQLLPVENTTLVTIRETH